jgi:hypothetical protein
MLINRRQAGMYRSDGTSWSLLDVNLSADKVYYTGTLTSENVLDALEELNTAKAEMIYSSVTLNVANSGGDFASLNNALAYLNNYRLAPNVKVTIQIADGTYTMPSTTNLNHPDLANIHIKGNGSDHTKVVLNCNNAVGGIQIGNGNRLGYLGGLTIESPAGYGIYCYYSSAILDGGNIGISHPASVGMYVAYASQVNCNGIIVTNGGSRGTYAYSNSSVVVRSLFTCTGNASDGIIATQNSKITANGEITSTGNGSTGAYALVNSDIVLNGTTNISGNVLNDLYAYYSGGIYAAGAVYEDASPAVNTIGNANSYIFR